MISKQILVVEGSQKLSICLIKALLQEGHRVTYLFLDRPSWLEEWESSEVRLHGLKHDLCGSLFLPVDEVYDLSCTKQASEESSIKRAIFGAFHLLALVKRAKARLLQLIPSLYEEGSNAPIYALLEMLSQEHSKTQLPIKLVRFSKEFDPASDLENSVFSLLNIMKDPAKVGTIPLTSDQEALLF